MKTLIESNSLLTKQVFSENNKLLHRYVKYPLGEDYYSFKSEEKEMNGKDPLIRKDSSADGFNN